MAGFKPAVALLLCVIAFALSCSTVSAADAAPAVKSVLKHPLGSGLNSPVSLNLTPKRGRRFLKLMQKLIDAARKGDLTIAQQIQQQLFAITGPKHHRRHLLQDVPAEDTCPVFADTLIDTTGGVNPTTPTQAGTAASGGAGIITPPATAATGPLPTIRFATLEPCAEFGCRRRFSLARRPDGTIFCRDGDTRPPVAVEEFAYFQVYDYDVFWDTDADNVLSGLYAGSVTTNENQLTSARGSLGASTSLGTANVFRGVFTPFLGIIGDSGTSGEASTKGELSKAVGDVGVLKFTTTLPSLKAEASYGAVLPGTVATEREGDASDDNVVFRTNNPALYAFGKKH